MSVVRLFPLQPASSPSREGELQPEDADLVLSARQGDRLAQEQLFRRHVRRAAGLAQRLLATSPADVDDLVQDVFILAFTRLDSLKEPKAFGSWLGSIVVRTASKRMRRHQLRVRLGLARRAHVDFDDFSLPYHEGEVLIELKQLYLLLERFPADERVAVLLRRVEGMEINEIAERTAASASTVKRRLRRAESRLLRFQERGASL